MKPGLGSSDGSDDVTLNTVMNERARLLSLSYRLLSSLAEAEDAVQETYARWYGLSPAEQEDVNSPAAWLTTVASRVCLDVLRSARARRENYVGEWIPEPVPSEVEMAGLHANAVVDPADRITLDESIDMGFMVLLDAMTPAERVAFLLHDVFRYPFAEIGQIVGRTPAACRQLAVSARRRIREVRPMTIPTASRAGVVRAFKKAWESKDVEALIRVLDPGATVVADGGGVVPASLTPIDGAERIARYLVGLATRAGRLTLVERSVNGEPGLVAVHEGVTSAVFAFDIRGERIMRVWGIRNPEKLQRWQGEPTAAVGRALDGRSRFPGPRPGTGCRCWW